MPNHDVELLEKLLSHSENPALSDDDLNIFGTWLDELRSGERIVLSRRQRSMAVDAQARVKPFVAKEVPSGRVGGPWMLRPENLPKRPPGARVR
jgi:hypothetical protein